MVQEFFRKQTEDEKRDFTDIGPHKRKDPKAVFLGELSKKRLEVSKKKLPFFKKAAMNDFDDYYKEEVKKSMRKNGYVDPTDIKPIKINWDKYSSPDNIELVEVTEVRDPQVSKKHPFDVFVKTFRYKYEGYGQEGFSNMSVMEEAQFAVRRARADYENKPELVKESLAEKQSKKYIRGESKEEEEVEQDITEEEADEREANRLIGTCLSKAKAKEEADAKAEEPTSFPTFPKGIEKPKVKPKGKSKK